VFWLPNLSSVVHGSNGSNGSSAVNITAAVSHLLITDGNSVILTDRAKVLTRTCPSTVDATLSVPSAQPGTLSPRIEKQSVPLTEIGLYTIYSAILEVDSGSVYMSSVDVAAHFSLEVVVDVEGRKLSALQV
jgi:hypothetical protein